MNSALFWWSLTLLCILIEGFYCSIEMALVSLNRVRLTLSLSQGNPRAKKINWLMQNPSRLFGTTLIGVNLTMQLGSECSRRAYEALSLNPDLAFFTQVPLVLIFAELVPIFGARRYPEQFSAFGLHPLYISNILLRPLIAIITHIADLANRLLGGKEQRNLFSITREELKTILEEIDPMRISHDEKTINLLIHNILNLHTRSIEQVMLPLREVIALSISSSVRHVEKMAATHPLPLFPLFDGAKSNIVAVLRLRDLLNADADAKVRDFAHTPWFIPQESDLFSLLEEFKRNRKEAAIVLNPRGKAIGIVTLKQLTEEIFAWKRSSPPIKPKVYIDRTFDASISLKRLKKTYQLSLDSKGCTTLGQFLEHHLGHPPYSGDRLLLPQVECNVTDSSLLSPRKIHLKSLT